VECLHVKGLDIKNEKQKVRLFKLLYHILKQFVYTLGRIEKYLDLITYIRELVLSEILNYTLCSLLSLNANKIVLLHLSKMNH